MKFPTHIILDWNSSHSSSSSQYWIFKYLKGRDEKSSLTSQTSLFALYFKSSNLIKKNLNKTYAKSTVSFSNNFFSKKYTNKKLPVFKKFIQNDIILKKNQSLGKLPNFWNNYQSDKENLFHKNDILILFKNFCYTTNDNQRILKNDSLWRMFDISFIRKEKIYTKLKYSRVPQYDIVSGGAAALFAGFLGFLICEKFGFELLDSGDFYTFVMYLVFFSFFARVYLKTFSSCTHEWNVISIKWFVSFYKIIVNLFFNFINKKFRL